jgi:hypothetical protein
MDQRRRVHWMRQPEGRSATVNGQPELLRASPHPSANVRPRTSIRAAKRRVDSASLPLRTARVTVRVRNRRRSRFESGIARPPTISPTASEASKGVIAAVEWRGGCDETSKKYQGEVSRASSWEGPEGIALSSPSRNGGQKDEN